MQWLFEGIPRSIRYVTHLFVVNQSLSSSYLVILSVSVNVRSLFSSLRTFDSEPDDDCPPPAPPLLHRFIRFLRTIQCSSCITLCSILCCSPRCYCISTSCSYSPFLVAPRFVLPPLTPLACSIDRRPACTSRSFIGVDRARFVSSRPADLFSALALRLRDSAIAAVRRRIPLTPPTLPQ